MATHKPYTREFKIEAVKLVTEQDLPRTRVAHDLGLDIGTLRRWLQEFDAAGQRTFAQRTPRQEPSRDDEVARLRRENERLRQERDILKKALGIFSRMPE